MEVGKRGYCFGETATEGWFEEAICCGKNPKCRSMENIVIHKDWKLEKNRQANTYGNNDIYEPCPTGKAKAVPPRKARFLKMDGP
jgi:hypothetical protein